MKYFRVPIIGFALLCSCFVNATQIVSPVTVDNVRIRKNVAYIKFSGCSFYSKLSLSTEYDKAIYSAALTAGVSKKYVTVELDGDNCSTNELEILYIDVKF
jgi:hypothetical protein